MEPKGFSITRIRRTSVRPVAPRDGIKEDGLAAAEVERGVFNLSSAR